VFPQGAGEDTKPNQPKEIIHVIRAIS